MCDNHESRVRFEADSAIIVKVSVMWGWQWCKGIFLVNYRDVVCCESERATTYNLMMYHNAVDLHPLSLILLCVGLCIHMLVQLFTHISEIV